VKVLVIGGGAREHALVWKLRQSPRVSEIVATPGNAGIAQLARCLPEPDGARGVEGYVDIALDEQVDLTIVGPERLLVDGIVDAFQRRSLRVFGPTAHAARLEGSKIWAKEVMQRVGIPTASWRAFTDVDTAKAHAGTLGWRCVIKADGLAQGKGAFVCKDWMEVQAALDALLVENRFGGGPVIVEELLDGQEVSVFALSDGRTVVPFGAAQDHKRARDLDEGPNTGGMGAYSPVNHMQVAQGFAESFFQPIVSDLAALGAPYVGVLYAGAMVTDQGPKILEFNCRFGDPEAEVLLSRFEGDLGEILWAATAQQLHTVPAPVWTTQEALCVVVATDTYPDAPDHGTPISGVEDAERTEGVLVFHAGTAVDSKHRLVTNGGRIITVTALGDDLKQARARAYQAVDRIMFSGRMFRTDIGAKAIGTVWNSEWRKPPRWELKAFKVSQTLDAVANGLDGLQTQAGRSPEDHAAIDALRRRVYEAKLTLTTTAPRLHGQSDEPTPQAVGGEPLSVLSRRFDALLLKMQSEGNRKAVDRVFRSFARSGDTKTDPAS
jgi:phosphoribosylamine--glycine ligase